MPRNGRSVRAQFIHYLADALLPLAQRVQDADSFGISQAMTDLCLKLLDLLFKRLVRQLHRPPSTQARTTPPCPRSCICTYARI